MKKMEVISPKQFYINCKTIFSWSPVIGSDWRVEGGRVAMWRRLNETLKNLALLGAYNVAS